MEKHKESESCDICPHLCQTNRYLHIGKCRANSNIEINLSMLHYGEEPIISGTQGSGTIFFSHCNLKCVFCQNYKISQLGAGKTISITQLVDVMLDLQNKMAHNINLVTPSHYSTQIIEALKIARNNGLSIPVIWNSNGYENVETLQKLEPWVDVYLPDFKYFSAHNAEKYSGIKNYPQVALKAIKEMFWQKGELIIENGIVKKGVIIRLLILPNQISETEKILKLIHQNFGTDIYVSLMSQYYPAYKSDKFELLNRGINISEHKHCVEIFEKLGFNGFIQEISCSSDYTPDFS